MMFYKEKWVAIYSSNKCDERTRVSNPTAEGSHQSGGIGSGTSTALNAVGGCDVALNAVVGCLQKESSMIELVQPKAPCSAEGSLCSRGLLGSAEGFPRCRGHENAEGLCPRPFSPSSFLCQRRLSCEFWSLRPRRPKAPQCVFWATLRLGPLYSGLSCFLSSTDLCRRNRSLWAGGPWAIYSINSRSHEWIGKMREMNSLFSMGEVNVSC
ncbi:unnamed protein product, partial [Cuscuta epithymum]